MKTEISLASRVKINQEVLFQELQGEAVLLNLKSGVYLGLDSVGTRIWNLLQQRPLLQDVRDAMLQEYDVSAEQCERDLLRLVSKMEQQGLAEIGT
jgi:hypothetical protein